MTRPRPFSTRREKQVDNLARASRRARRASIAGAEAKLEQARLNLSYTTITAPIDGVVGDRALRSGQYVAVGANLLTLVPMGRDIYLVANFKETQVGEMAAGQPVDLHRRRPRRARHSKAASPASPPGTGSQFALLPPENATGNFTKVVQRVPVKIALDADDALLARLRPGLSVTATVRIGSRDRRRARCAAEALASDERDGPRKKPRVARLARGVRRHSRRLHRDPRHPDHQFVAAPISRARWAPPSTRAAGFRPPI